MKPLPDAPKPAKRPGRGRPTHDQVGKRYAAELRGVEVHPAALALKAWRVRNGLSQPQAAEVLRGFFFYVTFSTLRSWEEGQRVPPDDKARLLETLLQAHPKAAKPGVAPAPSARPAAK
ncbi:MAG TPA: helix-turn-helix domain-containing protein [Chthoniobacterales bacterium]